MKICMFQHSLLNRGGDKMVIANHLQSRGHEVIISANLIKTVFKPEVKIQAISTLSSKLATIFSAVFKKRECDILVGTIVVMIFLLSIRNRNKLIYFAQDYDEYYYKNPFLKMLVWAAYFYCLKLRKIPVIAVSERLGLLLRKRFNAKVAIVPNGVDADFFYPDLDKKYKILKGDSKAILVFSRSDYRKGFDTAIQVISRLNDQVNKGDISLWAVGEPLHVPFKVRNFGFVPAETLRKILSCSDVLLYPSRHEGFGLLVLESMACGCPVVTSEDVPIVDHDETALVCKKDDVAAFADAVNELLCNDVLKRKIVGKGLKVVKKYSLSASRISFEQVLLNYHRELSRIL